MQAPKRILGGRRGKVPGVVYRFKRRKGSHRGEKTDRGGNETINMETKEKKEELEIFRKEVPTFITHGKRKRSPQVRERGRRAEGSHEKGNLGGNSTGNVKVKRGKRRLKPPPKRLSPFP